MPNVNSFWPTINLETRTPREILEEQAQALATRTRGLLLGVVELSEDEGKIVIRFVVEAPTLGYRHVLFSVEHGVDLAFPAVIISPVVATTKREEEEELDRFGDRIVEEEVVTTDGTFGPFGVGSGPSTKRIKRFRKRLVYPNAHSESEFVTHLQNILRAPSTLAVINSLIARIRGGSGGGAKSADDE